MQKASEAVHFLNGKLVERMLVELGLPVPESVEEGRDLIALHYNDDTGSFERFRASLVREIKVECVALSDGSSRVESEVAFEDGRLERFQLVGRRVSSNKLTPSEEGIKARRLRDLQ